MVENFLVYLYDNVSWDLATISLYMITLIPLCLLLFSYVVTHTYSELRIIHHFMFYYNITILRPIDVLIAYHIFTLFQW